MVEPGMSRFTDTDRIAGIPTIKGMAATMSPLGRIGAPEDLVEVVGFLCAEEGRWLTGQNVRAAGGVV